MTPRQTAALWHYHDRQEKAAERAMDTRFAALMAFYANAHRDPDKRSTPWKPADFMQQDPNARPHNELSINIQTVAQQKQTLIDFGEAMKARRGGKR